ncbi:hypothetical protein ACLEUL_22825, partial [Escherichia coli]
MLEQACREKSKVKSADIINFPELISRKGFSSEALNGVLDSLNASNSLKPDWDKALMNPLMILVKIIKLRWIHILSYDQMVSRKINNQTTR